MTGKQTPKGGQEMINDSSSYNEEISEEKLNLQKTKKKMWMRYHPPQ